MTRLKDFSFNGQSLLRPVFIETGTFHGESLRNALHAGFPTLHSIEICKENYDFVKTLFERFHCLEGQEDKITLHLGSSPNILPLIINPNVPTTFWLDAHFQDRLQEEQDTTYGECPLLLELNAIFSFNWNHNPIVLIDDAHMFDDRIDDKFNRSHWPTLKQIKENLPTNYKCVEQNDVLFCLNSNEFKL